MATVRAIGLAVESLRPEHRPERSAEMPGLVVRVGVGQVVVEQGVQFGRSRLVDASEKRVGRAQFRRVDRQSVVAALFVAQLFVDLSQLGFVSAGAPESRKVPTRRPCLIVKTGRPGGKLTSRKNSGGYVVSRLAFSSNSVSRRLSLRFFAA